MKCEINISYLGDTVRIAKEDEMGSRVYPDGRFSSNTAQAIELLDQTFQHIRSALCAALDKRELAKVPVIAIVPADKAIFVQEALNK